jgi:non-homologous end joining protein Ku
MPRRFSSPAIVALLPQRENGSDVYSGLHVITLPFADEFRIVPNTQTRGLDGAVDEQLVDLAKVVVERTMFKEFNPKSVENIGKLIV